MDLSFNCERLPLYCGSWFGFHWRSFASMFAFGIWRDYTGLLHNTAGGAVGSFDFSPEAGVGSNTGYASGQREAGSLWMFVWDAFDISDWFFYAFSHVLLFCFLRFDRVLYCYVTLA